MLLGNNFQKKTIEKFSSIILETLSRLQENNSHVVIILEKVKPDEKHKEYIVEDDSATIYGFGIMLAAICEKHINHSNKFKVVERCATRAFYESAFELGFKTKEPIFVNNQSFYFSRGFRDVVKQMMDKNLI